MKRRTALLLVFPALGLSGCAGLSTLQADVSTFGDWPAARAPGSYAFERLPSQQAQAESQQRLEDAAHAALQAAGFTAASPGASPDVLVQLGARISRAEGSPWDDPLWWRGGFGAWRYRPWVGGYWALPYRAEPRRYDREVALLLRDRASGAPLYEARASSEGNWTANAEVLTAMFKAALTDFPLAVAKSHSVAVPIAR